jgi:tetratricopeptide (TPR) repeat protein
MQPSTTSWNIAPGRQEIALLMEAGFILRDMKKFEEARQVFTAVHVLMPSSEVPEVAAATVTFQEGRFDAAIEEYNRILLDHPRSAWAHAQLAEAYIFNRNIAAAEPHLKQAISLDRRGPYGNMARSLREFAGAVRFV